MIEWPRRKRRALVLTALGGLLLAAALYSFWHPWMMFALKFLGANSDTISGLSAALQILLGLMCTVLGVRAFGVSSEESPGRQAHQMASSGGQNIIGENITNTQHNHYYSMQEALEDAVSSGQQPGLLPPPPDLLVGRDRELQLLKSALGVYSDVGFDHRDRGNGAASRRVITVHGWPGVGKTSLVSCLCHDGEVLERFSGGIFFLPLGRSPEFRRLTESICGVLEIPIPPGASLDELRGLISNALSQRRVLLIFDDVWEERHMFPLSLAGRPSATLVTTRRLDVATTLASTAESDFKLDVLSEDDSLEVLRSKIPDIVAENLGACRELVKDLDGLPLALRVAADLLRVEAGVGFGVVGLLSELREAARLLKEEAPTDAALAAGLEPNEIKPTVRVLLQKSVERMGGDSVRRFAQLGVLPPKPLSFDQWTASEVWDEASGGESSEEGPSEEHKRRTREALGDLVRRGLVEPTAQLTSGPAKIEKFQIHALVAAFALETLNQTEGESGVREAQQRRLDQCAKIVGAAAGALDMGGPNQFFGLQLLDENLPNIKAAHAWARLLSSSDQRALAYLTQLLSQGSRALATRLFAEEFLDWIRLAEKAAQEIGDAEAVRKHRANIVPALLMKGLTEEALPYCRESLQTARDSEDAPTEAAALGNLATIYGARRDYATAISYAQEARDAACRAGDPSLEARAIGQQAAFSNQLGRTSMAEMLYEEQRDFARDEGQLSEYAKALRGLADLKRERPEERDETRQMYDQAVAVFFDLGDHVNYRGAMNGRGVLEGQAGSYREAEEAFERCLDSAVESENKGDQAMTLINLGNVYWDQDKLEEAEAKYREALPLASGSESLERLGDVLSNLARLLFEKGDRVGAYAAATDAVTAYENVGSAKEAGARKLLGEIDDAHR